MVSNKSITIRQSSIELIDTLFESSKKIYAFENFILTFQNIFWVGVKQALFIKGFT